MLSDELSPIKRFFEMFLIWFNEINRCENFAIEITDKNVLSNICRIVNNSADINRHRLDEIYSEINRLDPTVAEGKALNSRKITEDLAKLAAPAGNYSCELINSLYKICSQEGVS